MSRIAATCYLSGSRLGVVFDDFGSTHCGKKKLRKPVLTTPIFTLIIPALLYLFTLGLLPCLYKASKTRQNDLTESAGIGKEKRQKRYCGNLSTERGKRNCSPKNQKGQTTKKQQHFFYPPNEFSMTKWQTISFSCKTAEDQNSSCLRGLNWLSVF